MTEKEKSIIKCQALDQNGKRCSRVDVRKVEYHGNPEIYYLGDEPNWVRIYLCKKHRGREQ